MRSWFRAHRAAPFNGVEGSPLVLHCELRGRREAAHPVRILSLGSLSMASVVSNELNAFTLMHAHLAEDVEENVQDMPEAIEWGEDAIIEVGMSLDAHSEEVLEKVKRAAERLRREYGVDVVVVPRMEYWSYGQFTIGFSDYPRVRVNGLLIAAGDISEEDVIDAVLAMLGMESEADAAPDSIAPHAKPDENPIMLAAGVSA